MAQAFPLPVNRALDTNGITLPGAKLYFYATGTTTLQSVYTTSALSVAHTNPVVADAGGLFAPIFLDPTLVYRVILKTSADATIQDVDPVSTTSSADIRFVALGTGVTSRTVQDKLRETVTVKDFGAVGDGVTNDRAAFAAAALAARGKKIIVPKGNYLINSDGGSITLEEVDLVGEGVLDGATSLIDQGTNLWITGTTNSPFKVRRGVSFSSLGIYYPNQTNSATPTAYPATLAFDFTDGAVQFVHIRTNVVYNAYKFIEINDAAGNVGHVDISGNYICALNRAIYLRHNAEHIRIERNNFTFGHWLEATEAGARSYMRANATAIQVDKSDGVEVGNNLMFGHLNGMLLSASGFVQLMNIVNNKIDQCRYGIKATGTGNFSGLINGNTFNCYNSAATTLQGRSLSVETTGADVEKLVLESNNFAAATEEHIYTSGAATRTLTLGPNNFRGWAAFKAAGTYGAVNINGASTNLLATGVDFYGSDNAPYSKSVVGSFNTLQVSCCRFDGGLAAIDATVVYYTAAGNRSFNTGGATSDVVVATNARQSSNIWDKPSTVGKHAFIARDSTAQVFNSTTATDVVFGNELLDTDGCFASPSFTAKVAGLYQFTWMLTHDNTVTVGDRWNVALVVNGTALLDTTQRIDAADYESVRGSYLASIAVGDVVKLQVRRLAGAGSFTLLSGAFSANSFSGVLVG